MDGKRLHFTRFENERTVCFRHLREKENLLKSPTKCIHGKSFLLSSIFRFDVVVVVLFQIGTNSFFVFRVGRKTI